MPHAEDGGGGSGQRATACRSLTARSRRRRDTAPTRRLTDRRNRPLFCGIGHMQNSASGASTACSSAQKSPWGVLPPDADVSHLHQRAVAFWRRDALACTLGDILLVMRIVVDGRCSGAGRAGAGRAVILAGKRDAVALIRVGLHWHGAGLGDAGERRETTNGRAFSSPTGGRTVFELRVGSPRIL
jgi:hypothetical protein